MNGDVVIKLFKFQPQGVNPHPLPLPEGRQEIIPLLPTGIDKRFSQTISNLGHAALFLRCELPL
jgi:hypothetical protein